MHVARLWCHPVKSMAGVEVPALALDRGGVRGDRRWAVHDVARATTASARRLPALLGCRARFASGPDDAPLEEGAVPAVVVTLPDGTEVAGDDPAVHDALSRALDREVRLHRLPDDPAAFRLPWRERLRLADPRTLARDFGLDAGGPLPDLRRMDLRAASTLLRNATPPGSFVDLGAVHLLTESSLATVGEALDDEVPPDPRRFRPNVLLGGAEPGLPEAGWRGAALGLGGARLRVTMPTVRCAVPGREHVDLPRDRRVTRTVATAAGRYLGAYADVTTPGTVRVGDAVHL